jgi:general secretion pathway protein G
MTKQSGFTLIEIMVVVIIIGMLAAIVTPKVVGRLEDARIESAKANMRTIEMAVRFYRVDNFSYPTSEMGLAALVEEPTGADAPNWRSGGYLEDERVPLDPWGQEFLYLSPGPDGSDYYVYTLGADKRPGGDGANADLSTSDL